jgi:hypothetical protein
MDSYVVWIPGQQKHQPLTTERLDEALDQFKKLVLCSYDNVTLSQQFADGSYLHIARFNGNQGVPL